MLLPALLGLVLVTGVMLRSVVGAQHEARQAPMYTKAPAYTRVAVSNAQLSSGLASNACLAFAPNRGNRHLTVFVDPGHGGADPGATGSTSAGTTIYEKDLTLETGRDLLPLLRQAGFTVVMSRLDDTLVARSVAGDLAGGMLTLAGEHRDTEARIACANASRANVLVAIHFNAYGDSSVNGAETVYDSARPFAAASLRLARLVQKDVVSQLRSAGWAVPDRGVIDDIAVGTPALSSEAASYGHVLELGPAAAGWLPQPSSMPGILSEPLFLTHPAEADIAAGTHGRQVLAQGLAQAIAEYFDGPVP